MRTETSSTYRNDDGSYTTELSTSPMHQRDDQGRWQPIRLGVTDTAEPGFAFEAKPNSFEAWFKRDLRGGFLRAEIAGLPFSFSLEGASAVEARRGGQQRSEGADPSPSPSPSAETCPQGEPVGASPQESPPQTPTGVATGAAATPAPRDPEPTASPKPTAAPDYSPAATPSSPAEPTSDPAAEASPTAEPVCSPAPAPTQQSQRRNAAASRLSESSADLVYPGAFPGADIEYSMVPGGLKETVVLNDAAAPIRYRFALDAPQDLVDLEAFELPDGSWSFAPSRFDEPVFMIAAPYAVDSGALSEPETEAVSIDVQKVRGDFTITLSIDARWLHDPARTFPVYVDPTLTIQPTSQDAYFFAKCATCLPNSTYDYLKMGTTTKDAYRTAVKFDLSSLPSNATVSSAELGLYWDGWCLDINDACPDAQQFDAHGMNKDWTYSSKTADVGFDAMPLSSFTLPANPNLQWMKWSTTSLVRDWVTGARPNYGFYVKKATEPTIASGVEVPGRRDPYSPSRHPRLIINYTQSNDGVQLEKPQVLHSNGAELSWSRFASPTGNTFDRYEVHRSSDAAFVPSVSTLLTTIRDVNTTSFTDTTAAPNRSFTYKVTGNADPSGPQTVTLPAEGKASMVLQPTPTEGKSTYLSSSGGCLNDGASDTLRLGAPGSSKYRPVVSFDLRDIPSSAAVSGATLSLYSRASVSYAPRIDVHRVTRAWQEGTGAGTCTGNGATWSEADGGVRWSAAGGDFDPAPAASLTKADSEPAKWDDFNVTSLVQSWANGTPNQGFLLKAFNEAMTDGSYFIYASDDYSDATLRPKLSVTFADGSRPNAPSVAVSAPGNDAKISGSAVNISAAASDDRRVDKVEFFVDGTSVGGDTAAPFEVSWNSTAVANGNHSITAVATDDAGNRTTSTPVTVSVGNSAAPTTSISAPLANATVKGTQTVSANASDDGGVTGVEFFVDGIRIGERDTTAPYSVSWNTLDSNQPTYDGAHTLTSKAYDVHGQVTTSAGVAVTVANASGTKYLAGFSSTAIPQSMSYDPQATMQQSHGVDVTVTNNSGGTWLASDVFLRWRWIDAAGAVVKESGDISLGSDLMKGRSKIVSGVLVQSPSLPDGVDRSQYTLRFDMWEKSTNTFFAAKGNKPLENPVIVNKLLKTALGMERYHHYVGEDIGAGMTHLANVANGNSLLNWTPFSSPGRGLSTVVGLTYNSLEDRTESPVGNNFSLSVSSLTRFGLPLDIHPNKADSIAGRSNKYIEFTDGDGTTHRFTQNANGGWDEPAGVRLYLREYSTTDLTRKWAITRPDRVTFFYNDLGYPTGVEDKNGNRLDFTLEDVPAGEDPGGVKKRITKVTDAAGLGASPAANRSFTIDYYSKDEVKKPQIRGRIEKIVDHTGSALVFEYYEDGNLLRLTQKGGTKADGSFLADKSFVFTYTNSAGDAAAIPAAGDRVIPDPKTPNQSTRLFSVRDPRGNETTFTYFGPTSGLDRWKLKSRTNRAGNTTSLSYDLVNRVATVTEPLSRVSKYDYDVDGQVTKITAPPVASNPQNKPTLIAWGPDRQVTKLTEPNGAYTTYAYNDNGYLTDQKVVVDRGTDGAFGTSDDKLAHTQLTYRNVAADDRDPTGVKDVATKWKLGRTIPHVSLLETKTTPRGMDTPALADDFQWRFSYDAADRNLLKVTEPEGSPRYETTYSYNADGTLASTVDANKRTTNFEAYDSNGFPQRVTRVFADAAKSLVTEFDYTDDGLLSWVQDPLHAAQSDGRENRTSFLYDSFQRLGAQSTPKLSTGNAPLIWSVLDYDANDNVTDSWAPEFGYELTKGPRSTMAYDAMDRITSSSNADGETTSMAYDAAGRLIQQTAPKGTAASSTSDKDHATFFAYDDLDRIVTQTRYDTSGASPVALNTNYCYDPVSNVVAVNAPKAKLASPNCGSTASFTTRFTYDDAHRRIKTTDPMGRATESAYDLDGNVRVATNELGDKTERVYDQRGLLTKVIEPFNGVRSVTSTYSYDAVGNLIKATSPRAFDSGTESLSTRYDYDEADRLVRTTLPSGAAEQPYFVYRDYDANGNVTKTTLPDAASTLAGVPSAKVTAISYFDTGWVRADNEDPTNNADTPQATYDYNARGLQTERIEDDPNDGEPAEIDNWVYHPADDMLIEQRDRGSQGVTYAYDANNNLQFATDASGLEDPRAKAVETDIVYDTLDRVAKVRHRRTGEAWNYSSFAYDDNGNVTERIDDATEGQAASGKKHTYSYDDSDRLKTQLDYTGAGCRKIDNTFTAVGLEATRVIRRSEQSCADTSAVFTAKQSTQWDWFRNGKLQKLTTRSGGLGDTIIEQHSVDYVKNGTYFNGNRTQDVFFRKPAEGATGPKCDTAATQCTAIYDYDARDRLVFEDKGHGQATTYKVDEVGNVREETTGATTTFFDYDGSRLKSQAVGTSTNVVLKYLYDNGNLDCIVDAAYQGSCGSAGATNLVKDYDYDYLDRLKTFSGYDTATNAKTDEASYVYDALDRVWEQSESHGLNATPKTKTTTFSYIGLTKLVAGEEITGDAQSSSKTYSYDVYGNRIAMQDNKVGATTPQDYLYAYDVHGSVSMLLNDGGASAPTVKATYGYDAYGDEDKALTTDSEESSGATGNKDPLNSFRYTAKRFDTGSDSLDMGARRFSPDVGRFMQRDQYLGALSNLGLGSDPLTQNRYSLAGGNPLSFIESDGHRPVSDGRGTAGAAVSGGGGDTSPNFQVMDRNAGSSGGESGGGSRGYSAADGVRDGFRGFANFGVGAVDRVSSWLPFTDGTEFGPSYTEDEYLPSYMIGGGYAEGAGLVSAVKGGISLVSKLPAAIRTFRAAGGIRGIPGLARGAWNGLRSRLGGGASSTRSTGAIGFAPGEGASALTAQRLQHGTLKLQKAGLLPQWSGKTSPQLIRDTLGPILERPTATFDHAVGQTAVKGFLGEIRGQQVAVMVYREGPFQGELATSVIPSVNQLAKWGL